MALWTQMADHARRNAAGEHSCRSFVELALQCRHPVLCQRPCRRCGGGAGLGNAAADRRHAHAMSRRSGSGRRMTGRSIDRVLPRPGRHRQARAVVVALATALATRWRRWPRRRTGVSAATSAPAISTANARPATVRRATAARCAGGCVWLPSAISATICISVRVLRSTATGSTRPGTASSCMAMPRPRPAWIWVRARSTNSISTMPTRRGPGRCGLAASRRSSRFRASPPRGSTATTAPISTSPGPTGCITATSCPAGVLIWCSNTIIARGRARRCARRSTFPKMPAASLSLPDLRRPNHSDPSCSA